MPMSPCLGLFWSLDSLFFFNAKQNQLIFKETQLSLLFVFGIAMKMGSSVFFILLLSFLLSTAEPLKCGHGGLEISYPFRLKTHQPQRKHCGDRGFDLFCRGNSTMIHFPSYGDLVVKSISYDTRKLNLLDPKNCVHEVFLNLNLSSTPFHYYYAVKNYTYLNCSALLGTSVREIPCLSGSQHHVYTVESTGRRVPDSCRVMKTVAIPFGYSSYLSDNSFGLGLTWDSVFQSKTGRFNSAEHIVLMVAGMVVLASAAGAAMTIRKNILNSHRGKKNQMAEDLLPLQHQIKAAKVIM